MNFLERDERDQLKIASDESVKKRKLLEKLWKLRDARLDQVENERRQKIIKDDLEKQDAIKNASLEQGLQ